MTSGLKPEGVAGCDGCRCHTGQKGLRSHHGKSGEANRLLDQCGVLDCVVGKGLRSHHGKSGEANRLSDQCGVLDCVVGRDTDAFSDPFSGCTW